MTCEECRNSLMDVLYGEEVAAQACYQFFHHLDRCEPCDAEFKELIRTREMLGQWEVDQPESAEVCWPLSPSKHRSRVSRWLELGWPLMLRAAAGILILVGAVSILQTIGIGSPDKVAVSEQQLLEMVNDMIVVRQAEERRIIGQALVNFADQITLQQEADVQSMDVKVSNLERRYLENIEETNHYLKTLLSR